MLIINELVEVQGAAALAPANILKTLGSQAAPADSTEETGESSSGSKTATGPDGKVKTSESEVVPGKAVDKKYQRNMGQRQTPP
ncbi:hypothetical protein HDE_00731 [Halotydeus destructor]|nr:hypothetical protein HDE_00731 [Halotydeus destructor]